jgi:hypothetical protein
MSVVDEVEMWLDNIQDLEGRKVNLSRLELRPEILLPYRSFSGLVPDYSNVIDAYWGNVRSITSQRFTPMAHTPPGRCESRIQ